MNILVTGGCGFIGSNLIKFILEQKAEEVSKVVNLDSLTYAADLKNTDEFVNNPKYTFAKIDLCDIENLRAVIYNNRITHIIHLAAESHVDNSIKDASAFIQSNIVGTFNLLKMCKEFDIQRFHHVSTDEVYGDLGPTGKFDENTPYDPKNPYSASKASSDMLVRAYHHTYNLPITISNCSNNYGPNQHSEKFIPTVINCLLDGRKIPLYGSGTNIRDWIYVEDHCSAVWDVFTKGRIGETYCIGSDCEKKNIDVIEEICAIMNVKPSESIKYVKDRLGHDQRYAIDSNKIINELGWNPSTTFEEGLRKTIEWYNEKH
jgi:dTDP-glucose 4,6-dehydratase